MQQYFLKVIIKDFKVIKIDDELKHHIFKVMRFKDGSKVRLIDLNQNIFLAEIKNDNFVILEEILEDRNLKVKTTAILALTKIDKFELSIQKLIELGVTEIVPLITKRTVVKINDITKKMDRWNKIVLEALRQCKRNDLVVVKEPIHLKDIALYHSDLNIVADESSDDLSDVFEKDITSISFVIGPEGGFEKSEIVFLNKHNFKSISLGKRIYRAETAAIFMMSVIAFKFER